MRLLKYIFIGLIAIISFSCTDIYEPNTNANVEALIVEGILTNEVGPYFVKLTMAKPITSELSNSSSYEVSNAKVVIYENDKIKIRLSEVAAGMYTTPSSFQTKVGNTYRLEIITSTGNTYTSNTELLSAPQTVDSLKAISLYKDYLTTSLDVEKVKGAEVRADLFGLLENNSSVPSCRFDPVLTYQYFWTYRDRDINGNEIMSYHWDNFGWRTYNLNSYDNFSEEKNNSESPEIKNHIVCFFPFEPQYYSLIISQPKLIFYLRLNQYTLNHDSYRFYKSAKNQLSASGKIFDPINSQLFSNMRCVNNSTNIVSGLFEVSSLQRHSFVIELSDWGKSASIRNTDYIDIPSNNDFQYRVSDPLSATPQNDDTYIRIPLPVWWYHN